MNCWMVRKRSAPTITLAYICVTQGRNSPVLAQRFVDSYKQYPPGYKHDVVVICNGGSPGLWLSRIFKSTGWTMFQRSNDGWDIGGFIHLANETKCDCLMCLGESVYAHRAGWLWRIAEAWDEYGPGMYGVYSSYLVRPHMNTTAFAIAPEYLREYRPQPVLTRQDRYEFEHGLSAMWKQTMRKGGVARLVTWDGEYLSDAWRSPSNILWNGDQSNCLLWSNHTQRYMLSSPETKLNWEMGANGMNPNQKPRPQRNVVVRR